MTFLFVIVFSILSFKEKYQKLKIENINLNRAIENFERALKMERIENRDLRKVIKKRKNS